MKSALKTKIGAAFVLLAVAGGAAYALSAKANRGQVAAAQRALGVVSTERDGFRYEFHAPSGRESLFDIRRDPNCLVNLASTRTDVVAACRSDIEKSMGLRSIEELRAPYAESIRRLEALGYL
jgi:hypothetical protein